MTIYLLEVCLEIVDSLALYWPRRKDRKK